MREHKHLGVYGLIIENEKILLINKVTGPYDGKLDLPGGSINFTETPEETLKREIKEETGLEIEKYELYDANSVVVPWKYKEDLFKVHHVGILYKVLSYKNKIKTNIKIDEINDDSLGANFYTIKDLKKEQLSEITILELEKLGYKF